MKRLLPSPGLSVGIFCGWLVLNESVEAAHLLLALGLAVVMPLLMAPLRPVPGPLRHPKTLGRLILRVGRDVVRSALDVARGVMRAGRQPPRGTFVLVPLDLRDTHGLAALAVISAVIPGTVWSELAPDHSALLIHVFDLDDEDRFITHFKNDYERPLREIFE